MNLATALKLGRHVNFEVGRQNVLNTAYSDHLAGINRVMDSDVGLGQPLPGAGRSLYGSLTCQF